MRNIKYYIIFLMTAGCSSNLDQVNPNQLVTELYYKTPAQAQAAVDAIYNGFIIDGAYNRVTPVFSDGRSDEVVCKPNGFTPYATSSNFDLAATHDYNGFAWNAYYAIIYRANQVFTYVPPIQMNEDLKGRMLGQAHFLRALAYFNLSNFYDEVPLILKVPDGEASFYAPTSTRGEIWAQIKTDLIAAVSLLPVSYTDVSGFDKDQIGRATKGAALALLGKVYLYNKDYANAIGQFDALFALNRYALAANYKDNFTNDTGIENANPETIFSIEFTTSTLPGLNWGGDPNATWRQFLAVSVTYSAKDKGFHDFDPSAWLYSEMRQEKTIDNKLDPRFLTTILSYEPAEGYTKTYGQDWIAAGYAPTDYYIKKYTNADFGVVDEKGFNSGINYNVIRLADVFLMYAECKNELNDPATCAEYIQKVRDRAKLPNRKAEFSLYSQAQMRDQISHERVMELAIEGTRIYDIIRWGWLYDPLKLAMLQSHDIEFKSYFPGKEYLKIPQGELDLNKNLKPNSAN